MNVYCMAAVVEVAEFTNHKVMFSLQVTPIGIVLKIDFTAWLSKWVFYVFANLPFICSIYQLRLIWIVTLFCTL